MTREELIGRLQEIEWEDFEVKEASGGLPKSIWETVSAFSNTAGGWIVLGVKQKGKSFSITGVTNPEQLEQDFTNTLRGDKFNVKIRPDCKKYEFQEGTVLAFYVPLSDKKPIYFNVQANTFVRTASGDQRATKEEIDAMFRDQSFGTKTDKIIDGMGIDDLDERSLNQYRDYLQRFNPDHPYNRLSKLEFLEKLRVLVDGKLTYSGLLFLGKEDSVQRIFTDFRIDYFEIPGKSYSDAKTRYTFRLEEQQNLWQYYFAIFDRLRQRLDLPFKLTAEGFASTDYPQLEAIREALVNLLMHTDYFSPAKPRIRAFDNRIEFFNPGGLPKPLDKIMAEDISMPRNGIVAKLFRVIKLAENGGYGFDKMINGWKEFYDQEPEFITDFDRITVVMPFDETPDVGGAIENSGTDGGTIDEIGGTNGGTIDDLGGTIDLTIKQEEIVALMRNSPKITVRELSKQLDINKSAVQGHIEALKNKGAIVREGGTRGYWKVLFK